MDAPLMFEVLLYLNVYYYAVFAGSEMLIFTAKFNGPIPTPNIHFDGIVVGIILLSEIIKLVTFNRIRVNSKSLSNIIAQVTTAISIACLVYVFGFQKPVLKMEYMVCTIMLILLIIEFSFGFLQFVPCCKKKQYAE